MRELAVNCALCGLKNVAATPRGAFAFHGTAVSVFATCNGCRAGLVIYGTVDRDMSSLDGRNLLEERGTDEIVGRMKVDTVVPKPPEPRHIGHLPDTVGRAFRQAEEVRAGRHWTAAAGAYRTTLERALKAAQRQEGEGRAPARKITLSKRIEALAAENAIPQVMIDLMNEVRFLGNEIHEEEDPEPAEVHRGAEFTALLLTYMFELPGRVKEARANREAVKG